MKIFSGSANRELAEKVAKELHLKLSEVERFVFPDGEQRVRVLGNVVEEDCIIIQSASTPVDEGYMELFFLIDALKRSGAATITLVMPYMGYQRQDHIFRDGESVSLEVVITLLTSLKIDYFISFDMHSSRIPDLFPSRITVSHLSALPLFAKTIRNLLQPHFSSTVLVSPDMGGIRRIKILSEMLGGINYAAVEKNRDLSSGNLEEHKLGEGSVKGKKYAIIVDDIISSGQTLADAAFLLERLGVKEIYAYATHAVFAGNVGLILQNSPIKKVFVTDSIKIPEEKKFEKLNVLSIASLIEKELNI